MRYPITRERVFMSGLGSFEAAEEKRSRRRRKTVCASARFPFEWLKVNPCIELPEVDETRMPAISTSADAAAYFHNVFDFAGRGVEHFMLLCVNALNVPMAAALVHLGGRTDTVMDPASILLPAILAQCVNIIVAHNHPSNTPEPSEQDVAATKRLFQASKAVGIRLLDHLVLTNSPYRYTSFTDVGLMPRD